MTIITGTRRESTVVRGCYLSINSFILNCDHWNLRSLPVIHYRYYMAVAKYSKQPTKLSTKKSTKLKSI